MTEEKIAAIAVKEGDVKEYDADLSSYFDTISHDRLLTPLKMRIVDGSVLKRMARFLNRKSQRHCRLTLADTYYGKMTYDGLCRLAWADVRRTRG